MAAKQKLDMLKLVLSTPASGSGANIVPASQNFFFFMGQKESYSDLNLTEAECGVDEPTPTELAMGLPLCTVGSILKSGQAVRMKANGTTSTGKKVTRSIIVSRARIGLALADVNDGTPVLVDGAPMRLVQPTRRRLV